MKEHSERWRAYMTSLDLYGRVIRNLEFINLADKERHVGFLLRMWTKFLTAYMERCSKQWREVVAEMKARNHDMDDKKTSEMMEYLAKIVMPISLLTWLEDAVSTPKLEAIFEEKVGDTTADVGSRLASLFILLNLKTEDKVTLWRKIWMEFSKDRYLSTLLFAKLCSYYMVNPLEKTEREGLESLMSEMVLNRRYPRRAKGQVISELRKRRQRLEAAALVGKT